MEISFEELSILKNVGIAVLLCAAVGFERESLSKPAGLRTNMIIGGAACLLVAMSIPLIEFIEDNQGKDILRSDPVRVIQALVVGISFIGAGTIMKQGRDQIEGLTTAATLLFSMAIGISVAIEKYVLAIGVTILILLINWVVRIAAMKFASKKKREAENNRDNPK